VNLLNALVKIQQIPLFVPGKVLVYCSTIVIATLDTLGMNAISHNVIQKIQRIQRYVQVMEVVIHSTIVHATVDILEINVNVWEIIALAILDTLEINASSHNVLERIQQIPIFVPPMEIVHL
jgi:hypothetical protein